VLEREALPPPTFTPAQIRHYYDQNTPTFLLTGQGGSLGAIHRAVWGPGVQQRAGAFHYVDDRIAELIAGLPATGRTIHVVDLGCGVGASICHLASRLPIRGTGVTISPVQQRLAQERVAGSGLSDQVTCVEGDYCALPESIGPADVAYAIESFVHGPSPERFFAEAARLVRPGGLLIVCDDLEREAAGAGAERTVRQFVRGWHINSLITAQRLRSLAAEAGFAHESTTDLTPFLELQRPRDRAIGVLAGMVAWLPVVSTRLAPLVGGHALQTGLARGWIAYELTVFRREPV
jgi:ubiquinone/menaquinone biosynthesis C-methylase UbiE